MEIVNRKRLAHYLLSGGQIDDVLRSAPQSGSLRVQRLSVSQLTTDWYVKFSVIMPIQTGY